MADLLLLTPSSGGPAQVLPALGLLTHRIRVLPVEPSALLEAPEADVVLIDARRDLATARTTCRMLRATGLNVPVILILTEGGPLHSTTVVVYYLYQQAFQFFTAGYAAAIATVLFVAIVLITVVQLRFGRDPSTGKTS